MGPRSLLAAQDGDDKTTFEMEMMLVSQCAFV
jgi:hypothetical protein